ncbi:unnamed protein product [Symbiodinium sp. CCMP2592]|nr:unnamed protein product [Symbiodinium sp. CCMP2592]
MPPAEPDAGGGVLKPKRKASRANEGGKMKKRAPGPKGADETTESDRREKPIHEAAAQASSELPVLLGNESPTSPTAEQKRLRAALAEAEAREDSSSSKEAWLGLLMFGSAYGAYHDPDTPKVEKILLRRFSYLMCKRQ